MTRTGGLPVNPLSAARVAVACKNLLHKRNVPGIAAAFTIHTPPILPRNMQLPEFDLESGTPLKENNEPLPVQERVFPPVKARPMRYGSLQTYFLTVSKDARI